MLGTPFVTLGWSVNLSMFYFPASNMGIITALCLAYLDGKLSLQVHLLGFWQLKPKSLNSC